MGLGKHMRRRKSETANSYGAIISFALSAVVFAAWLCGLFQPMDDRLIEQRFKLAQRPPTGDIVVVTLDAQSLHAIGSWPLPRSIYARVIDTLRGMDAADIAFDIDFSAASSPEEDVSFAAALERAGGNVILVAFNQKITGAIGSEEIRANRPLSDFAKNAWVAGVGVHPDPDGVVRSFPFGETIAGEPIPSIAAMLVAGATAYDHSFLIDFGIRVDQIETVSVIDLLSGQVPAAAISGKKVIVGATAVELRDFFQVPVYGTVPGALLEAVSAETLLQKRALAPTGGGPIALLLLVLAAAFATFARRVSWATVLVALAGGSLTVEGVALFLQIQGVILPTVALHAAVVAFAVWCGLRETNLRGLLLVLAGRELSNTRTVLDQVIADNFAGVVIIDQEGRIEVASAVAATLFGADSVAALKGVELRGLGSPELADEAATAIASLGRGTWLRQPPKRLQMTHGDVSRLVEYVITPSRIKSVDQATDGDDRLMCCLTLLDVTEQARANERLRYLAHYDSITGLANRNQFAAHLERVLRSSEAARSAVICFDLDRFKNVNDTLGHLVGDLLLKQVAERAQALIGEHDLVARLGGDEFAVVLAANRTEAAIDRLAASLVEDLGKPYVIVGNRVMIGVSAGLALGRIETNPVELVKNADAALYSAKSDGGNRVRTFDPTMDAQLRARQALEIESWDALSNGEFEVYYQPQVDLTDNRIVGVEALLRWRHPQRGFVSPLEFIRVAESTGLIEQLGAWAMRTSCKEVATWPVPLKLAVNVSPVQFARGDLVRTIKDALAESKLAPDRLQIEITESLFAMQSPSVAEMVQAIRRMGVTFALDDFGTGYSSLGYLQTFPVDKIKIDKSFVDGILSSPVPVAVVKALATLAESLNIRLNAEGIEQVSQAHALRNLGCVEGQGYLFSKPLSAADMRHLLKDIDLSARLHAAAGRQPRLVAETGQPDRSHEAVVA
jgi:diguanylate cyclase (GGDEF)-like protein